jgi:cytidyltransferase-like protein
MENLKDIIILFGTFDHLHAGHEDLFNQARGIATRFENPFLITIVARDKTVKQIKGIDPDNSEKERVENLIKTGWADMVVLGDKKDKYAAIKKYRPRIIVLGYDQFAFTLQLEKLIIDQNLDAKIVRLRPYRPEIYKSSLIRERKNEEKHQNTDPSGFQIKPVQSVQK